MCPRRSLGFTLGKLPDVLRELPSLWQAACARAIVDSIVAQLIVRNLDKRLVDRLKRRAAEHGRSAEDEHRRILEQVLSPKPKATLKELLLAMPAVGEDADFERQDDRGRKVAL